MIVLNGVYMEAVRRGPKQARFFCRTFTIVPQPPGFVIVNDLLMAGNSTFEQRRKYLPKSGSAPSTSTDNIFAAPVGDGHESIVASFAQQTGMTVGFARQCLQENAFDLNKSLTVFTELHQRGLIPPNAFA